jgi:hypothetical protein
VPGGVAEFTIGGVPGGERHFPYPHGLQFTDEGVVTVTAYDAVASAIPPDNPPTADAGGPYQGTEGGVLALDGSASTGDRIATYEWDLDYDGVSFDVDSVGSIPTVSFPDNFAARSIALRVTDSNGLSNIDTSMLTINNVAPTAAGIAGPAHGLAGETLSFTLTADDPSPVDQANNFVFHIDWDGDGSFDATHTGPNGIVVEHAFPQAGAASVRVVAEDKDGGQSAVVQHAVTVIQPVAIDVRPGDDSNLINLNGNGMLAVAIFSVADFEATQIDVDSVVFAGAHAEQSSLEDVNGDGRLDMMLLFRAQDTQLRAIYEQLLADDLDGDGILDSTRQTAEASLFGETIDDILIQGSDELSLFLAGRELREMLEALAESGALV